MSALSRRKLLQTGITGAALSAVRSAALALEQPAPVRIGRIHQSVSRWCYRGIALDDLCAYAAHIGLRGVDLLEPDEYAAPHRYGLICTMGHAGAGNIAHGLNRTENHAGIEAALRKNIPLAASARVPNVITFSGKRDGMSDEEGARNCVLGLNRVKTIAEDHGVTICMELLNSKIDHPDSMADHTAWGVSVMQQVNSPNVKLLYDIYHMQIMEGDLIRTIQANARWIGHFHTGGVPGRHELNDRQEVEWAGVMRGILASGFQGYVAHEFLPTGDPLESLRQAADVCDV